VRLPAELLSLSLAKVSTDDLEGEPILTLGAGGRALGSRVSGLRQTLEAAATFVVLAVTTLVKRHRTV